MPRSLLLQCLLLGLALALAAPASAQSQQPRLKVKPGRWEVHITATTPAGDEQQARDVSLCIDDAGIAPQMLVSSEDGCTISKASIEDSVMRWKVECQGKTGKLRGGGRLESRDDSLRGKMTLRTIVGGVSVELEQRWEGRWVGPCE